jgi:hypothetical protein
MENNFYKYKIFKMKQDFKVHVKQQTKYLTYTSDYILHLCLYVGQNLFIRKMKMTLYSRSLYVGSHVVFTNVIS